MVEEQHSRPPSGAVLTPAQVTEELTAILLTGDDDDHRAAEGGEGRRAWHSVVRQLVDRSPPSQEGAGDEDAGGLPSQQRAEQDDPGGEEDLHGEMESDAVVVWRVGAPDVVEVGVEGLAAAEGSAADGAVQERRDFLAAVDRLVRTHVEKITAKVASEGGGGHIH